MTSNHKYLTFSVLFSVFKALNNHSLWANDIGIIPLLDLGFPVIPLQHGTVVKEKQTKAISISLLTASPQPLLQVPVLTISQLFVLYI